VSKSYTSYSDKLKDPRWQKKRLEIMEHDHFSCTSCGATDRTLNVHHGYYRKGTDPWDYDDRTLWTMCEDCHEFAHDAMNQGYQALVWMASIMTTDGEKSGDTVAEVMRLLKEDLQRGIDGMKQSTIQQQNEVKF
jgi:hypothetical protein